MNESKMSILQTASVITTVMISHIILNMPNYLIASTGSATILNLIYVFVIALFVFYVASKIFELFPGKDIIDICEYAFGKKFKNIFSVLVCIYFITISAFVIRTFSESLISMYFPNINRGIVILMFIAIAAIMNLIGFKAISRVTLITMPVILFAMIIIFISSFSSFIPERALPILGYGASTTFISGLGNIFAFSSIFIAPFLIPYIGSKKDFKKASFISLIVYTIYLALGIIALLLQIPSIANINSTLSIYILSRRINLGDFIRRIDAVFILIWIMSIFNYLAITMHFTLNTFKKITNIKFEKGLIYCFSAILFIISLIPSSMADINIFESKIYKYASIIFVFFITTFILICAYFKRKRLLKKGVETIE